MAEQTIILKQLGRELKMMRKHKGWTQEQLATHSGINAATIGQIENELVNPEHSTISKIFKAFDMDFEIWFALVDKNKVLTTEIPKKKRKF